MNHNHRHCRWLSLYKQKGAVTKVTAPHRYNRLLSAIKAFASSSVSF